jgi:hypothetical protein
LPLQKPPILLLSREKKEKERSIDQDDQKGEPINPEEIRQLNKMEVSILRVSKKAPWKPGKSICPDIFQGNPERGKEKRGGSRNPQTDGQP